MWYATSQWKERLLLEQAAMNSRFPQFILRRHTDGRLFWEGIVEPVEDEFFRVTVAYPHHFPYREPDLHVEEPPIRADAPHVYRDRRLCTHRNGWDPARGTAASQVPLLCEWLARYVHWTRTGERF